MNFQWKIKFQWWYTYREIYHSERVKRIEFFFSFERRQRCNHGINIVRWIKILKSFRRGQVLTKWRGTRFPRSTVRLDTHGMIRTARSPIKRAGYIYKSRMNTGRSYRGSLTYDKRRGREQRSLLWREIALVNR